MANTGVTTANIGMIGYVDNKVSTANIGVIGYVDNKVSTANVGMKGYVDNQTYSNVQVSTYLPTYSGYIGGNVTIGGNLTTGILISNPNYITVSNNWIYTLSSTTSDNILLVTSTGLFATINMPVGPVDGQVATFSANAKVTLLAGSGTVQPSFVSANIVANTFRYIYRSLASTWYKN